jgi:hypothetical protein
VDGEPAETGVGIKLLLETRGEVTIKLFEEQLKLAEEQLGFYIGVDIGFGGLHNNLILI